MSWLTWALVCAFGMAMADASTKRGLASLTPRQLSVARCCLPLLVMLPVLVATWPADVDHTDLAIGRAWLRHS